MEERAINAYRAMWCFVFFDLPTQTKTQRKNAAGFRKNLLKDGFTMLQYSVYIRHCGSKQSLEVHEKRVSLLIPPEGQVSIAHITDKQYGDILNFWGKRSEPLKPAPLQLELF